MVSLLFQNSDTKYHVLVSQTEIDSMCFIKSSLGRVYATPLNTIGGVSPTLKPRDNIVMIVIIITTASRKGNE